MRAEKQVVPYEILIRLGTGKGAERYVGSHVQDLERIVDLDTGDVLAETVLKARPVTLEEVGDLLGKEAPALIEAAEAARAEIESHAIAAQVARQAGEHALTAAEAALDLVASGINQARDRLSLAREKAGFERPD